MKIETYVYDDEDDDWRAICNNCGEISEILIVVGGWESTDVVRLCRKCAKEAHEMIENTSPNGAREIEAI